MFFGGQAITAPACRLYLITPPRLDDVAGYRDTLMGALDAGDVACVQLRLKDVDDDAIRRAIDILRPGTQQRGVAFILNDRPDLAVATGCDGVHVGQQDTPLRLARRQIGAEAILGATCHDSRHLAMDAGEAGADYVAFGAFFPTTTKDALVEAAPLDLLSWWQQMMALPCVAIGGITVDNCRPLVGAGADFLAVCAGVWLHADGPAAAVRAFNRICAQAAG